jgi:hypothetical protein
MEGGAGGVVSHGFLDGDGRLEDGIVVVVAHDVGGDHDDDGVVVAVENECVGADEYVEAFEVDERVDVEAFEDVEAVDDRRASNMFSLSMGLNF